MALIESYPTLEDELKSEMDRTADTTSPWTRFIQVAEEGLIRDPRVKRLRTDSNFSVAAEDVSLPAQFKEMVSLVHDGDTYFDVIEIVAPEMLPGEKKIRSGSTAGVPRKAAILNDGTTLRFAPVPDATYTLEMVYWQTVEPLSATVQSNWLLDSHSGIYLWASVREAALHFLDEERYAFANIQLEGGTIGGARVPGALNELQRLNLDHQFGGPKVRRTHAIG